MNQTQSNLTSKYNYALIAYDLYWLRLRKEGEQWYELTDYIRDKLREDGFVVRYTKDDVVVGGLSVKQMIYGNDE